MTKTDRRLIYCINLCFFLYFSILLVERLLSVILSIANGVPLYGTGFHGYVYTLVFVSIIGWLVYLIAFCRPNMKALAKPNEALTFDKLILASGILLLSGMVHTEYTMSALQFVSYGILIVGILLKVIMNHRQSRNKPLLWLSFVYLVSFSMAIPVMYETHLEIHTLFHIFEAGASIALVAVFTYLTVLLFDGKDDLFPVWPILCLVVLDTPLIIMRWNEEINSFVLIFEILSAVLFLAGLIYKKVRAK